MTTSPAIEARDLVKDYEDLRALDGLSLTVDRGEFFGLLGPNGAGKTTFIEALVGLAEPTAGRASVFGNDVETDKQAVRRRVSVAPQEFNVDRFFPIHEVLEHAAMVHGVPAGTARTRAVETLEAVGLGDKRDQKFRALSGGMKRRFLLARALVPDPDLLVLDEPTAGVDVELRRDIWDVVQDLNDDGMTILLTTHYIEEAERLCDRVCVLDEGQKVAVDTPAELRRRGADRLRVETDGATVRSGPLRDIDGVTTVTDSAAGVTVEAARAERVLPELVAALSEQGCPVATLDIERASLEDVFVELTRLDDDTDPGSGSGSTGTDVGDEHQRDLEQTVSANDE